MLSRLSRTAFNFPSPFRRTCSKRDRYGDLRGAWQYPALPGPGRTIKYRFIVKQRLLLAQTPLRSCPKLKNRPDKETNSLEL